MLLDTYYVQNYASIIGGSLTVLEFFGVSLDSHIIQLQAEKKFEAEKVIHWCNLMTEIRLFIGA